MKPLRPTRGLPQKIGNCGGLAPASSQASAQLLIHYPREKIGRTRVRKVMVWNKDGEVTHKKLPDFQEYLLCKLFNCFLWRVVDNQAFKKTWSPLLKMWSAVLWCINVSQKQVNALWFFHSSNVQNVILYMFLQWNFYLNQILKQYSFPCNMCLQSEELKVFQSESLLWGWQTSVNFR